MGSAAAARSASERGGRDVKAISHRLVRPLRGGEFWQDALTRTPCAATVRRRGCKNDATHRTRGPGSERAYVNLCFTHAITYIEANTSDLVEGIIYEAGGP